MKRIALAAVVLLAAGMWATADDNESPCPQCPPVNVDLCAGVDVDGNGVIDGDDLQSFIALWNDRDTAADFNHDGIVDETDLFGDWSPSNGFLDRYLTCSL